MRCARRLQDEGVRYVLAGYVDMHGVSKSKVVPIGHLDAMMAGSELCTGAALDGVPQDVSDEEVSPRPDPESVLVLPWRKDVAWFASDLWCEGKPFVPCNRGIFKRVLAEAAQMGYRFDFGIEPEFFLLEETEKGIGPVGPARQSREARLRHPEHPSTASGCSRKSWGR